ncbi:hypothetical protein TIFTF001_018214 [Ficus carica]|uniref:Uncharacterized protein n=1 Tax=Ficus carica TaxID=3494 RepID=A0AA88A3T7_FICCA|nr:hypothetical protein TIFTF001_018214 [Ficus carica]
MARVGEKNGLAYEGDQVYTEDGTVDLKGRPVFRSKTGRWKACSFIVVYEIFERLAYQGVQANLVLYLTREFHQGTVKASNNVTNWIGTVLITPILGAYIADAYLGRFWTFLIASAIYLLGMVLLSLAVSVPGLKPPSCSTSHGDNVENCPEASSLQVGIFFLALYIIAVGGGGTKANISTLGADQFDEFEPREKKQKLSFFNWWVFGVFFGFLIAETFVVYIQDNVGWTLGYSLPTGGIALGLLVFLVGVPFFRHRLPLGSPFTKMAKVFVASFRKWKVPLPDDPNELHELSVGEYAKTGTHMIDPTPTLRFLDKAAVKSGPTNTPWTLCPVTQVEGTKQIVKLLPIFIATFIPAIVSAQSHTLFIKQGTTLDRSMGPHFNIPPAALAVFITIFMLTTIVIYDRCFVPIVRRYTINPRGISMLQRFGIGLVLHIVITLTACLAERKRLSIAREHGIVGKKQTVPLTVFILLPQFALLGIADAFLEVSKVEFFYDQAPEGMKSLGASFSSTSRGVGNFLSSAVLTLVSEITKRHGHKGWILDNLNLSRLDYFYALLAVLAFLNLLYFLVVAKLFVYNAEVKKSKLDSAPIDTSQN